MIPTEEFEWPYSVCRTDIAGAPPIQYFMRIADAKEFMNALSNQYPELPLSVFVRGDQAYYGNPAIHENTH